MWVCGCVGVGVCGCVGVGVCGQATAKCHMLVEGEQGGHRPARTWRRSVGTAPQSEQTGRGHSGAMAESPTTSSTNTTDCSARKATKT